MNLKDKLKLRLDTTILQSNTVIDLISYIKKQRNIIVELKEKYENEDIHKKAKVLKTLEYEVISEAFERIMKEHVEALHRRIGRVKYEKSFVDHDEPDPYEGIARIVRIDEDGNNVSETEEGFVG